MTETVKIRMRAGRLQLLANCTSNHPSEDDTGEVEH